MIYKHVLSFAGLASLLLTLSLDTVEGKKKSKKESSSKIGKGGSPSRRTWSEKDVLGTYGWGAAGIISDVNQDIVAVGLIEFMEHGVCDIIASVNVDGQAGGPTKTSSCEYTVESNGLGTVTSVLDGTTGPWSIVLTEGGKTIYFIRTDQNVVHGELKRQ